MAGQKYPVLELNGQTVQTSEDMILEFVTEDDKRIDVVVTAFAPIHTKFDFRAFERWTNDSKSKTIYDIIPASEVRLGGNKVDEFIGVGYSASEKKLILLILAIDDWGTRKIVSPIKYRSYGASSPLGKPRQIASVSVTNATEPEAVPSVPSA